MAETKFSLKLLVDTRGHKVLFAETGKEFVDFLFHIFQLPIGIVVNLLSVEGMVGSLGDLYKSIQTLGSDYLLDNNVKDLVLKPNTSVCVPLLSVNASPTTKKFYNCGYHNCSRSYVTDTQGTNCPSCRRSMSTELNYTSPSGSGNTTTSSYGSGGYVKGVVTYMVMDNLELKPMSTISSITLLNKYHIKDVSSLVEKEVQVGLNEGLAMLKASLETQDVLTTVFLGMKIESADTG